MTMIDPLFNSSTIPLLAKTAAFAERRHEVLSGNIANISTPDYRTRDLPVAEFRAALEAAVVRRQSAGNPGTPTWSYTEASKASLQPHDLPQSLFGAGEMRSRAITFQDGNNRSVEQEVMEITKNSLMQSVAIELMNAQLTRLQAVISERA